MNKPEYLFHYTSEARLPHIIESRELKVSKAALSKKERPALWLSTDPVWDDSALKFKDKKEQWQIMGLGRIVLHYEQHFVTYAKWNHVSGVHPLIAENERRVFNQYDRSKWWASFKNIPMEDFICIEYWDGQNWRHYDKKIPSNYNVQFANNNL